MACMAGPYWEGYRSSAQPFARWAHSDRLRVPVADGCVPYRVIDRTCSRAGSFVVPFSVSSGRRGSPSGCDSSDVREFVRVDDPAVRGDPAGELHGRRLAVITAPAAFSRAMMGAFCSRAARGGAPATAPSSVPRHLEDVLRADLDSVRRAAVGPGSQLGVRAVGGGERVLVWPGEVAADAVVEPVDGGQRDLGQGAAGGG